MKKVNIKELLKKQQLEEDIEKLEKKKTDLKLQTDWEGKLLACQEAKKEADRKYKQVLKERNELLVEKDLIMEVNKYQPKYINIKKRSNQKGEAIANLAIADWHAEESVKKSEVQGKNEYNLKIMEKRAMKIWPIFCRLVEIERHATDIKKAVIYALGDFLSGLIHDDLMMSNNLTPAEVLLLLEDIMFTGFKYIKEKGKFEEIDIICHPGNHSRYTKGKAIHYKGQVKKTFEWILYHSLAKSFDRAGIKGINFIIPESTIYINYQYGWGIRSQHGHNFKYNGGIGGATVPINRKLLRWNEQEKSLLDVFGHLHQYDPHINYVQCGSLIGYNQLAMNQAFKYQDPSQAFFLIGKKRGVLQNRPIYVG
jgi:hypothetical protein